MMQRNAFLQKGQLLTRRRSCDRVDNVNGDEGNKYPEVFCPEKSRLVQGITERQGKYLPEPQAECVRLVAVPRASVKDAGVSLYSGVRTRKAVSVRKRQTEVVPRSYIASAKFIFGRGRFFVSSAPKTGGFFHDAVRRTESPWSGSQITDEEIIDLINNGKATFYIGFDCTADSLTAGHFLALT